MEIRTSEESRQSIKEFSSRYLELLKRKREIDHDIKELKAEYKEDGVPVAIVTKAINIIKARKKKTDSQIFEEETIETWIEEDKDLSDKISELSEKL